MGGKCSTQGDFYFFITLLWVLQALAYWECCLNCRCNDKFCCCRKKIRQAICTGRQMWQFKANVVSMLGVKTQCLTKNERKSWKRHEKLFLGAIAILLKTTTSCVMHLCLSVRPSFRPHGTTRLLTKGFQWNLIFDYFSKIQVSFKYDKSKDTLQEDQYTFLITSHSVLLRMRNVSDKLSRENGNKFYIL